MRSHLRLWRNLLATGLGVALVPAAALASTWITNGSGNYVDAPNWAGGVPNGASAVADFSTLDTAGDLAVTLNGLSPTLGAISFGDIDNAGTPTSWQINSSDATLPVITLNNGASSPVITVNPLGPTAGLFDDAYIGVPVAGTNGFTKNGNGILTFGASSTGLTGTVNLNAGTLRYDTAGTHTAAATMPINMATGTTIETKVASDTIHSVTAAAGASVTIRELGGGSSFVNALKTAGAGSTANLEFGVAGATYSTMGDWGSGVWSNVNAKGLGATQSNFRLRINATGGWNGNGFTAANVNLDNVNMFTVTNSGGNDVGMASLSGTTTAILAGGNSGTAVRYAIGSGNTNTTFAGTLNGAGGLTINKVGTGTLTLSGGVNETNSPVRTETPANFGRVGGVIRVTAGTLATSGTFDHFKGGISTQNGTIDIKAGATLDVSGSTNMFHSEPFQQFIGAGTIKGPFNHTSGQINPGDVAAVATNAAGGANTDLTNRLVPTVGTINVNGNISFNGGTIVYDMGLTPGTDDLVAVSGQTNLGTGGVIKPNFLAGTPAPGLTYTVLNSAGGFAGATSGWTVSWLGRGAAPTVVTNGNLLQFTTTAITGGGNILWTGATDANWNIQGAVQNWKLGANPDVYFDGDNVTFDDTGNNTTVNIAAAVAPGSVVINASTKAYTFGGSPITGATGLTKTGTSTLTVNNTNSYTGTASIQGGTLTTSAVGAMGVGVLELQAGTSLNRGAGLTNSSIAINGAGVTINDTAVGDLGMPTITGTGSLTYTSTNTAQTMSFGTTETFTGTVNFVPAVGGTLAIRTGGATSDFPNAVVNMTATSFANRTGGGASPAVFSYGEIHGDAASTLNAFTGGSAPPAATTWEIGGLNTNSNFDGTITDGLGASVATIASLSKIGTGTLTLAGANTYTGDTTVNAGTLSIASPYLADAADVYVAGGAVFNLNFGATDTIDSLYLGGIPQTPGTYGAAGSGATFTSAFFTGTGILSVTTLGTPLTTPGDFNADNKVDGADFLAWQRGFPGTYTATDLANWKTNYGTGAATATIGAVPEPATIGLVLLAGAGLLAVRRK